MQLSYFKFVAGYIPLLTFSFWNLYAYACSQHEFVKLHAENMFTKKKKFVLVLLYDNMACMPIKIKYIKIHVLCTL